MSDKETKKKKAETQLDAKTSESAADQKKVVTSYDRKMERRRQEKEREEKEKKITAIVSVVVIAAIVALAASFPIRRFSAVHSAYVTINGEDVTKPEFDYNYNLAVNDYINQYGSYLSYFGLDTSQDFSSQMYSDTMTWKDYFEEMTVTNLKGSKALKALADAEGFSYNADVELTAFKDSLSIAAKEAGMSAKDYLKSAYGDYATVGRITSYMEEDLRISAYYDKVSAEKAPSEAEIQAYYDEHKADYDSVDFYQTIIQAQLPTEPTELADPVDDTDEADTDGESAYQPSEAEIAKAMADAKKLADAADARDGELRENLQKSSVSYLIRDWLFDDARKENDTTVIEDTSGNQYYVLTFINRYLDNSPTADAWVMITQDLDGQTVLDEWRAGEATQESFEELYKKYSMDANYAVSGGLIEGITRGGIENDLEDWLFAEERAAGDVTSLVSEAGYTYILYYVGVGRPGWQNSIKDTLLNDTMSAYMDEISAKVMVEDKHGKLKYLEIRAAEEAAAAENDAADDTGEAEDQAE